MLEAMEELLPSFFTGLPLHVLVIHLVVVLVPLATVVVALAAVLPRVRERAGLWPVALAAVALALTPVASGSGTDFQRELGAAGQVPAVIEHRDLGEALVWWVLALLAVAVAAYLVGRRERGRLDSGSDDRPPVSRSLAVLLAVAGLLVPLGVGLQTYQVGHSGAKAVWSFVDDS